MAIKHIPDGGDFEYPKEFGFHHSKGSGARSGTTQTASEPMPGKHDHQHHTSHPQKSEHRSNPSNVSGNAASGNEYAHGGHIHPHGHHIVHVEHHDGAVVHHHALGGHTVHHADGHISHHHSDGSPIHRALGGGLEGGRPAMLGMVSDPHPDEPESGEARDEPTRVPSRQSPSDLSGKGVHDNEYAHGGKTHHQMEEADDVRMARGGGFGVSRPRIARGMKPAAARGHSPFEPKAKAAPSPQMPTGGMPTANAEDGDQGAMPQMHKGGRTRHR